LKNQAPSIESRTMYPVNRIIQCSVKTPPCRDISTGKFIIEKTARKIESGEKNARNRFRIKDVLNPATESTIPSFSTNTVTFVTENLAVIIYILSHIRSM
jgi:hypothetical protein